jgi:thiol:disulfide interchange protein DsbD
MRRVVTWRTGRPTKAFLFLLALALTALSEGCGGESRIEWGKDLDTALARAKEIQKPIMIDFTATWCPPCHAMEDSTFSAPVVIEKSLAFIPVRIDVDEQREVAVAYNGNARKYGGVGIPNILFLDADGGRLKHVVGYHGPEQFVSVIDTVLAILQE